MAANSAAQAAKLTVLLPSGEAREVALADALLNIGKASENALALPDPSVSRHHAAVRRQGGEYVVLDLGSSNGTFVNGQRVGPEGQALRPGDVIIVGRTQLIFDLQAAAPLPAPPPAPAPPQPAPTSPPRLASALPKPAQPPGGGQRQVALDGRYELETKLAEDATGTLYRARRVLLGDKVAVRILRRDLVKDLMAMERFRRQAQVAARIHHPHSVQIYDFGSTSDGAVYIVEELLSGRTLRDLVREERGLTLARVVGIFNQVCGAVHTAHLNGIVLRDLKPESIFVEQGPDGKELVKVGGYGLAKVDRASSDGVTLADQAMRLGAHQYISPSSGSATRSTRARTSTRSA
jgi:hypothetical protein